MLKNCTVKNPACSALYENENHSIFQLLGEDRFSAIDKIKTVGSTYMAAVGLIPDKKMTDEASSRKHMATLVEFVFAMRDKLKDINDNSYNNFMLRVG